ncbi:3-dehydroquinate synthase [Verrucomicrobiota bacterium]
MKTVHVDLGERGYDISIGSDLSVGKSLAADIKDKKCLLVSDSNVDPLYGETCKQSLEKHGFKIKRAIVPSGESSKSLERVKELYDMAFDAGLERNSFIVALGGGMVGDLAGFAAATFMRGISLVQVPTSLLAMVDSSVGGKTGVNVPQGKNLIGSFHQPVKVIADLSVLSTLPDREYISGIAEVVKYGVIWDADFFKYLEKETDKLLARDTQTLETVVARCCEIKAEVVAMDERESGVRAVLNFGHTLGHALENVLGYGKCLHGEAISVGMAFASEVSVVEKEFPREDCKRLIDFLRRVGLPVNLNDLNAECSWSDIKQAMAKDKKVRGSIPRFVLAKRMGSVVFGCEVNEGKLEEAWECQQ